MESVERHQQPTSAYHRVIPDCYNPLEEEVNRNKQDKLHIEKLKIYVTRVTI